MKVTKNQVCTRDAFMEAMRSPFFVRESLHTGINRKTGTLLFTLHPPEEAEELIGDALASGFKTLGYGNG